MIDLKQLEADIERFKDEENRRLRLAAVRDLYRAHYATGHYLGRAVLYFGAQ